MSATKRIAVRSDDARPPPEARNRPRAAAAEADLTARRAAPVLGFSALLAFHARQCAVTPLFAAGAAPQALKKTPRSHGPHMYWKM